MTWYCAAEGAPKCDGHDDEEEALAAAEDLGRAVAVVWEVNDEDRENA